MKKQLFAVSAVAMIAGALTFTSCKQEDVTPPTLTITGGNAITHTLNATFTNPTATATDDEDGDISANVTVSGGPVNANLAGTYTLTYSVSDAAGNSASQDVVVTVKNDADLLAQTYSSTNSPANAAVDTCQTSGNFNYNATVTSSTSTNGAFVINNFGGFGTTVNVNASLSGTTITVPGSQTVGGNSSIVTASGSVLSSAPLHWVIAYTWTDGQLTEVCGSDYRGN
jgi:trimeric autotransporter adhesin